jgi:hypothetical protein
MPKYKSDHTVGEAIAELLKHDPDAELWVEGSDGLCIPWNGEWSWIGSAVVLRADRRD